MLSRRPENRRRGVAQPFYHTKARSGSSHQARTGFVAVRHRPLGLVYQPRDDLTREELRPFWMGEIGKAQKEMAHA